MATYKEIYEKSLTRVSEDIVDPDLEVLDVVKNAINEGYLILRTTVDKRNKVCEMDVDSDMFLPKDCLEVNKVTHEIIGELSKLAYSIVNDQAMMLSKDITIGAITLNYAYIPNKLVNDNDVLVLKEHLEAPLIAFGAYVYMLYKKKYGAAQMLQQEFIMFLNPKNTENESNKK